jgi:hypothetical protein
MALTGQKYIPSESDIEAVYDLACQGASTKDICEHLQIDYKTYITNLPIFSKVLKKGKRLFDKHLDRIVPEVVNSLKKKCLGYDYEEIQTKQKGKVVNGQLINGDIEKTVTKKHVPASDVAIIFFLSNRDKDKWKNSHQIDHLNDGKAFKTQRPIINVIDNETKQLVEKLYDGQGRESRKKE